jgi:hypothetical protein
MRELVVNLTLRQLKTFAAVAKHLSFTRAWEELHPSCAGLALSLRPAPHCSLPPKNDCIIKARWGRQRQIASSLDRNSQAARVRVMGATPHKLL